MLSFFIILHNVLKRKKMRRRIPDREDEYSGKTIITIPYKKIQKGITRKKKRSVFVRDLMMQEKCNLCKINHFKEEFVIEYGIPQIDVDEFLVTLTRLEERFVQNSENNTAFLKLNLIFLKLLQKYFSKKHKKNFINLPIIIEHFKVCVYKGLKNERLKIFRSMGKFIECGITPQFLIVDNADTNEYEYNHENIKSLHTLQRSQDIVLSQYLKLNKIM